MYQNCSPKTWKNETSWNICVYVGGKYEMACKVIRQERAD
jgi:hypothetical protein